MTVLGRCALGALLRRSHHVDAAHRVHGQHIGPAAGRGVRGALHLVRNVVELEVEEHLEAALLERVHDGRAVRVEQRHSHLHPRRLALQLVREVEGLFDAAVERHDHAIARGNLFERTHHSKAPISCCTSSMPCLSQFRR